MKQGTVSSLTLLVGIMLLANISACLLESDLATPNKLRQDANIVQHTTGQLNTPLESDNQTVSHSLYWYYIERCGKQYLNLLPAEIAQSQLSSLMLTSMFFLLFLSAGLPSYTMQKYKTPKNILEFTSLLMSWIKPIKGTPS